MAVGSAGVADYVNTTSGDASGVTALYGVAGAGVAEGISATPSFILAENNDPLITESSNNLITE